ncbi:unnamed protein product [Schistosoma curassoni]|uniref:Transcriptional regulator n=1 Tax=Schistosoma curassoni TaxID=6186 RepID=A0A183JD16_9TREM|nr:unnamed protein product [Schistosoma curassoni]
MTLIQTKGRILTLLKKEKILTLKYDVEPLNALHVKV